MEQEKFTYVIGGRKYLQRPLVFGQVKQLSKLMKNIVIPGNFNPAVLIAAFGEQISAALAIVLCEAASVEGKSQDDIEKYLRERDRAALEAKLDWSIEPETIASVIDDFFDCNPIASLLEKFGAIGEKIMGQIKKEKTPSTPSLPSSPEETSPKETASSGDAPPETANRT